MKTFYAASLIFGFINILFSSLITLSPAPGSAIAYSLFDDPTQWEVTILEKGFIRNEDEIKDGMLSFIESNRGNEYDSVPYSIIIGLVLMLFGGLGLYRESVFRRKLKSND